MRPQPSLIIRVRSLPILVSISLLCFATDLLAQSTLDGLESGTAATAPAGVLSAAAKHEAPEGLNAADWSSIRAAYETQRHAVFAVEGEHRALNPGQQWLTHFDGRGFTTKPDAGAWSFGLQLEHYGFAGQEHTVCEPTQVTAQGKRLAYDWDATLQEWWVNDSNGLEHGYTVRERPSQHASGPLTFALAVRGELKARVHDNGRDVSFSNSRDVEVLTYGGLIVSDADGQLLDAWFEHRGAALILAVDECNARYPLTIDPLVQQAYIKASNIGGAFGYSVSISGDTVVVGAYLESSNATVINGNQADLSAPSAGAAYVFVRSGGTWSQQAYLKPFNTGTGDAFGTSVSVSGDTIVVGAYAEDSNFTGVNSGGQANNSASRAGAAYIFVRSGTTWTQQAYVKAGNTETLDDFGLSVSVSGDTVVVGAWAEDSNATGVNGNPTNNSAGGAGAAYVFIRIGTNWLQQAYLKASNTGAGDSFGISVSVSGETVVVGAYNEASAATGVNGNQADNSVSNAGAAYVFTRSAGVWSQQAYLKASNTGFVDQFGYSVSLSGDRVVVGAAFEDSSATGVDGNQADNSASNSGAAYVFVRSGTTWSQEGYLKASNTEANDNFGWSVSVSGDRVAVGAYVEDSNATGVDGNQADNSAPNSGAAYLFGFNGVSWIQLAYLKASNAEGGDRFGSSVSVSNGTLVVGADREASNATGVNGNQADNSSSLSGASYVFVVGPPRTHDECATPLVLSGPNLYSIDNSSATTGTEGQTNTGVCEVQGAGPAIASDLWYTYTSTIGGTVTVSTCGLLDIGSPSPDSKIAVYLGAGCPGAVAIACNDDTGEISGPTCAVPNQYNSTVSFASTCGATYTIQIGMYALDPLSIRGQFSVTEVTQTCPTVSTPLCFGDGTDTTCPCTNPGLAGRGCDNTAATGGAALSSSGTASVSADTLVLNSSFAVPFGPGLYYEGSTTANPTAPFGVVFGNGLRCAGGATNRLEIRGADGAGAASTTVSLQLFGAAVASTTYYYQLWYRDTGNVGTCLPGAGFNFSHAISLAWVP